MSLVGIHRPRPTPLLRNMIRITSPTRSDFLASGYFDNQQQILFLLNLLFTFCNGGATMLKPCIGFTAHSALLQRHLPELPLPVCLSGKLKAPATCLELWILAFSHASGCRNDLVLHAAGDEVVTFLFRNCMHLAPSGFVRVVPGSLVSLKRWSTFFNSVLLFTSSVKRQGHLPHH